MCGRRPSTDRAHPPRPPLQAARHRSSPVSADHSPARRHRPWHRPFWSEQTAKARVGVLESAAHYRSAWATSEIEGAANSTCPPEPATSSAMRSAVKVLPVPQALSRALELTVALVPGEPLHFS